MKSLLIIRHAKSNWDNPNVKDFDRPLNERGHVDAPAMAKRLKAMMIPIDAFVSSPANRAFTTAAYFATAYGLKEGEIIKAPSLYHAPENVFYEIAGNLDDSLDTVAIFSHNPGITEFVNTLTNTKIDNMPTCAVFAIKTNIQRWNAFMEAEKNFWFFDYPKKS